MTTTAELSKENPIPPAMPLAPEPDRNRSIANDADAREFALEMNLPAHLHEVVLDAGRNGGLQGRTDADIVAILNQQHEAMVAALIEEGNDPKVAIASVNQRLFGDQGLSEKDMNDLNKYYHERLLLSERLELDPYEQEAARIRKEAELNKIVESLSGPVSEDDIELLADKVGVAPELLRKKIEAKKAEGADIEIIESEVVEPAYLSYGLGDPKEYAKPLPTPEELTPAQLEQNFAARPPAIAPLNPAG